MDGLEVYEMLFLQYKSFVHQPFLTSLLSSFIIIIISSNNSFKGILLFWNTV